MQSDQRLVLAADRTGLIADGAWNGRLVPKNGLKRGG